MKEKRLENARICPKGDIEANWDKAIGFIPKDKEIIIYKADAAHPVARFKIGDGVTAVQDLDFSGADMIAIEKLVNEKGELLIEYVDNAVAIITQVLDDKLDKSGGLIGGDLSVQGNLNVTGTTTTKDTETILVKDNVIVANSDGNELLEEAGFAVKTGAAAAYGIMYDPVGDGVKIGLGTFDENGKFEYTEGEDQFLATRDDEIADGNLVKWDDTKKKLVDSGENISEYVKKTDKPAYGKVGVVVGQFDRMGEGIDYSESYGYYLYSATNDFIAKRGQDTLRPGAITCLNLDDALKIGVTGYRKEDDGSETLGNQLPLTTEEQQAALSWLGAVGFDYKATQTTLGLVKGSYYNTQGVVVSQDGQLSIAWAGEDIIQGRYHSDYTQGFYKPIVPKFLDKAVKWALTGYGFKDNEHISNPTYGNHEPMTEEEQGSACEWLGAVKKETSPITAKTVNARLYAIDNDGNQITLNVVHEQSNNHTAEDKEFFKNSIPIRNSDGNIEIGIFPYWNTHATSVWYVKNVPTYLNDTEKANWIEKLGVLKKDTSTPTNKSALARVYGIDKDGNQVILDCVSENSRSLGTKPNTIAMRDGDGNFEVALIPYFDNHAASKRYVEYYMPEYMSETDRARWREKLELVKKIPANSTYCQMYMVDKEGNDVAVSVGNYGVPIGNSIIMSGSGGNVTVNPTPELYNDATSKQYVDNLFAGAVVAKPDNKSTVKAYCVGTDGKQVMYNIATSPLIANTYAIATYLGEAAGDTSMDPVTGYLVSKRPTKPGHVATKGYVDDLITALTTRIDELTAEVEALKTNNTSGG